jgi:tetratricopeptide (TPR) repeat protein
MVGQHELAQKLHEESLKVYQAVGFRQGQVDALTDLGILARDNQQFDQAKQYLSDALQIALEMGDLHSVAEAYLDRGDVCLTAHQFQEAMADYVHAVEVTESIRALLQETEALGYFNEARLTAYKHLIRLSIYSHNDTLSAFSYMERMKSREFLRRLSVSELPQSSLVPNELLEQEAQLLPQLRQLAAILASSAMTDGPLLLGRYQTTEKLLSDVWTEMKEYDQEYVELRHGMPISWKDVKNLLIVD